MALFEKKTTVFQKKDKEAFEKAKSLLKEAGIKGIRSGAYENEPPVCGCGSKLDPRDFGSSGKIDRKIYYLEVPVSQEEQAIKVLRESSLHIIEQYPSKNFF
ncbi:MAG: hypothetical protein PUI16_07605 [Clostridia bacterium]|nr:hypothetical protein [Clostridia bacterium]MDY5555474.1 hypothetical protein [Blautia sp.]